MAVRTGRQSCGDRSVRTVEAERAKYTQVWARPEYRVQNHGLKLWETRPDVFPAGAHRLLDIGTGTGRLMGRWLDEGLDGWGLDIVDALDPTIRERYGHRLIVSSLWELKRVVPPFDVGVAADMLEHLPTEQVYASLKALSRSCRVVVAQTAEFPSVWGSQTLHLTIRGESWWREQMETIGGTVERFSVRQDRGKKHLLRWTT